MENIYNIPEEQLSGTLKSLRRITKAHSWKKLERIAGLRDSFIFATRPDGKAIKFCNCTTPDLSNFAYHLAYNKYATYSLLKDLGIKQPETRLIVIKDGYVLALQEMLEKFSRIVIKPKDGAHGNDVFTNISTLEEAENAVKIIKSHGYASALIQEQLNLKELEIRVICIGYKFIGAYTRIPAQVTGDGAHTARELVDLENSTIRTAPYRSNLSFIDVDHAKQYLKEKQLLNYIPKLGEKLQVTDICNTGQGGTMECITDSFPKEKRRLSEKIALATELPVIGIDFLGNYIIEINAAPALYHPVSGSDAEICVEKWVEYLEGL